MDWREDKAFANFVNEHGLNLGAADCCPSDIKPLLDRAPTLIQKAFTDMYMQAVYMGWRGGLEKVGELVEKLIPKETP